MVGVPLNEAPLVSTLLARIGGQFAVAPGYARVIIEQAPLPNGVPDILEIHASTSALRKLQRDGLRLRTPREAAVLERLWDGGGLSSHERTLQRRLAGVGWSNKAVSPARVAEAIAYEVKVRDWQAGIHQLNRYMRHTSRGVLALPVEASKKVPSRFLQTNGVGLIAIDEHRVAKVRKGRRRPLTRSAELWLAELAVRALPTV